MRQKTSFFSIHFEMKFQHFLKIGQKGRSSKTMQKHHVFTYFLISAHINRRKKITCSEVKKKEKYDAKKSIFRKKRSNF